MFRASTILLALAAVIFGCWQLFASKSEADNKARDKPSIELMTSLPIIWGEGSSMEKILSGDASPAAIYEYWQSQYDLKAVDSLEGLTGRDTDIVMLAQPRAMDPADIALLDDWIRKGGHAIILTDPALVWHSDLPIGDSQRPLASGMLSPLLQYWGLELLAPDDERAGLVELEFDDFSITTAGVGSFAELQQASEAKAVCLMSAGGIMARCKVGRGQAILVADADFLNQELWPDASALETGGETQAMRFTDMLLAESGDVSSVSND
ncbi:Gldg family protein [Parasphingorhabdus halotolerans]|uniref:ABC-type uncharacterized transport system domain-containing protein n=1 Tax=Parasphingorhabdus halotolerans TaxID=2725558 RepID=A0A6H2DMQ2_9SPHN|nr:Gldg family protein [Parasphingorhabdus halotolerans]QJB69031.1 hypothetical protein HF685_06830 [Parasphingorhabdus halotolerans]